MANVQIPNLPAAVSIDGNEELEAVQSGTSVRITTNQIVDLAISTTALYPIYEGVTPTQNFQNNRILTSAANRVVEAGTAIADYITLGTQQTLQGSLTLANTAAGSFAVTLQSSNLSTASATYTLPPAPALAGGYILTSGPSGVMSWTNPTALGIDIDVNSTAITGGVNGRIVYDNAGTFGEISAITTNGSNQLVIGSQSSSQGDLVLSNTAVGAFPTHIKSSNFSSAEWTLTLPVTAGTNGYILTTDGSGVSSWTNPTALGIDIDVNSTAITGGTSGRLVYDNAGTFGEISAITTNGSSELTIGLQQTTQGSLVLGNTSAGAFSTTLKSSNSASAAWTFTLPTTAGTNNYVLTTNGSGVSSWSQVSLTSAVTGILPVANGGTGQSTNTIHGVLIGNAGSAINATPAGSTGQVLQSSGASADPTWSTATFPSTATGTGSILRADGTNWVATTATFPTTTTAGTILVSATADAVTASANPVLGVQQTTQGSLVLANTAAGAFSTTIKSSNVATEAWTLTLPVSRGTNGYILTTDGAGASAWTNPTALGIDIDVNSTSITGGTSGRIVYDNSGTFGEISAITTNGSNALTIGTQQSSQGSLILANTAAAAYPTTIQSSNSASSAWTLTLPISGGTNNYVLTTNGSGVSSWAQVSLTAGVTGILPVANGGTGQSSNTIHGVLIGNSSNAINATTAGTSGQILQSGGASADPTWTTATFPSTATATGTILRADGTNWVATTATYPTTTTINQILYSDSNNQVTGLSTANGGILNTSSSGVPSITVNPKLGVQQTTQGSLILANTAAGAFETTIKSSNSAIEAWTLTLPVSKGTSGYILTTDGSGVSSWTNPTSLGIDIDINSTAITSGTSGRLLYDNSATVGETTAITTNGSGTLTIGAQQTTQGSLVLGNTAVGAFATTIQSSNSASTAWTLTLPTTAGTNNYVLTTNGSGVSSWSQVSLTAGVTGTLPVGNGGTGITSLTAGYIPYGAGSGAFASTSNLFWDSANVRLGIKNSSPTSVLTVGGTTYFNGQSFVGEYDTALTIAGVSNSYLNIYGTGGGSRISIARFSSNTSGPSLFSAKSRSTSFGSFSAIQSGDDLFDFRFAGDDGSNLSTYPAQIKAIVTGAVSAGAIPAAITFGTTSSGNATEKMRIDSSGNVGIGCSPSYILDVQKPQNATTALNFLNNDAGASATTDILLSNGTSYGFMRQFGTGTAFANQTWVGTNTTNPLIFATNFTERMRIDSSGNVGIGTNSPSTYTTGLTVLEDNASATAYNLFLSNSPDVGGNGVGIKFAQGTTATHQIRSFYSGSWTLAFGYSGSDQFVIKSTGVALLVAAGGLGYGTGSGGAVTQITSRVTGVTIDKPNGAITLVSAAGTTTWQTFTVTNSTVVATDTVIVVQKSGTDLNEIHVTAVAAGSFNITFRTTGGTTTEQPVFNFAVIKAVTA